MAWAGLADAERGMYLRTRDPSHQDAAEKATLEIRKSEAELVNVFKGRGINIIEVDRAAFQQRVLKSIEFSSMGLDKRDWDRVVAIK
ncbi:MAG: hypothetical protein EBX62_09715 [Betaproteobacteria bacterium]|nr:hypothetical protein [Betaproteobacteria bacterium]